MFLLLKGQGSCSISFLLHFCSELHFPVAFSSTSGIYDLALSLSAALVGSRLLRLSFHLLFVEDHLKSLLNEYRKSISLCVLAAKYPINNLFNRSSAGKLHLFVIFCFHNATVSHSVFASWCTHMSIRCTSRSGFVGSKGMCMEILLAVALKPLPPAL